MSTVWLYSYYYSSDITLRLSYGCISNIRTIINNHNNVEIAKSKSTKVNKKNCNCHKTVTCLMDGNCNNESIIYQAEVITPNTRETNIRLCDTTFKLRYRNHICSFKNEQYRHATELCKYIWNLKGQSVKYNIKWKKVKQARLYSNVNKKCNLCLWEKYFIICQPNTATLSKRSELTSYCRHSKKFLFNTTIT